MSAFEFYSSGKLKLTTIDELRNPLKKRPYRFLTHDERYKLATNISHGFQYLEMIGKISLDTDEVFTESLKLQFIKSMAFQTCSLLESLLFLYLRDQFNEKVVSFKISFGGVIRILKEKNVHLPDGMLNKLEEINERRNQIHLQNIRDGEHDYNRDYHAVLVKSFNQLLKTLDLLRIDNVKVYESLLPSKFRPIK